MIPYADIDRFYPGDCWDNGCERGNFHQLRLLRATSTTQTLISVGGWTWVTEFFKRGGNSIRARDFRKFVHRSPRRDTVLTGVDLDWEVSRFRRRLGCRAQPGGWRKFDVDVRAHSRKTRLT